MNQSNLHGTSQKRAWRSPEIVNAGKVIDTTEVGIQNVRDNPNDKLPTYHDPHYGDEEVDLEGR
jgi:hypothetical protein